MRIRKLLLIHPSRSIRGLIKKYIFAELSDIEIGEAETGQQALDRLVNQSVDVILSAERLKDMRLDEFKDRQEATAPNGQTPLIIISESESEQVRDSMVRQGFDRVVQIRVNPSDLIQKINAVCDPRQWRKDTRYHIPRASVNIVAPSASVSGTVINVSKGGIYVELSTEDPCTLMNSGLSLKLQIATCENVLVIDELNARLLRLEIVAWTSDNVPLTMRATFVFNNLKSGPRRKLDELIQMAREDKLAATEVAN